MRTLKHEFVQYMPEQIEAGVIYIAMKYRVAIHLCVCGCGNKVVTPFSPTDWELRFNGDTVSLSPSIGNWNFDCQSHYWIIKNQIKHSCRWDNDQIRKGRESDKARKEEYFRQEVKIDPEISPETTKRKEEKKNWFKSVLDYFGF